MLWFQNLFVSILENVPLFSAIKRRNYLDLMSKDTVAMVIRFEHLLQF